MEVLALHADEHKLICCFVSSPFEGSMRVQLTLAAIRVNKSPRLDFIALAIQGKKIGFEKVIKMTDP